MRLAFDPTYGLRTNRLPRFDGYPTNEKMRQGNPEAEIVADLAPVAGEPVVDKGCVNAFIGTPLRDVLAAQGIRTSCWAGSRRTWWSSRPPGTRPTPGCR